MNLFDCIRYALSNTISLREFVDEEKKADINIFQQKMQFAPKIEASIDNSYSMGFQQVFTEESSGIYKTVQSYSNSAYLSITMSLWSVEAQKSLINIGMIDRMINNDKRQIAMFNIVKSVIEAFYSFQIANEKVLEAEFNLKAQEEIIKITKEQYKIGKKSYKDVLDVTSNLYQYKSSCIIESFNKKRSTFNLYNTMQFQGDSICIVSSDTIPVVPNFDELVYISYKNSPSILLYEHQLLKNKQLINSYYRSLFPSINLNYNLSTSAQIILNNDNLSIFDQWNNNFNQRVSISISIPIFNKLNVYNSISKTRIESNTIQDRIISEKQKIYNDLKLIYEELKHDYEMYNLTQEMLEITKKQEEIAKELYKLGSLPSYEYELCKQKLVIGKLQLISTKYEYLYKLSVLYLYLEGVNFYD